MTQPVVALFPEPGAWGPTNNLVALGNHLLERNIRTVFVVEESFEGELVARGFEERLMRLAPPPEGGEAVGEGWAEFVRVTSPEFRKPTIQQLETVTGPIWDEFVAGAEYSHDRLTEIWSEVQPDAIVLDCVASFPSVSLAGCPWARVVSANPLELPDVDIAPVFSGYPADDRTGWDEFRAEYRRVTGPLLERYNAFHQECDAEPLPDGAFQYESPYLNLYMFPAELDYPRSRPLGPSWHRIDTSTRNSDGAFDVAERVGDSGTLVYLSLGSLGCMDVPLMQRVIDSLDRTPHRVIVSMGPLHDQLRLGDRMWGEQFVPQTAIVPQCDVMITHGGNNTVGEAFTFGVPTIVLPLFWDQYDNAQRIDECGYGVRLSTYEFTDEELHSTIGQLIGDEVLGKRLGAASRRLQASPGRLRAADLLEGLIRG
ncbi:nucleotide disphospho-sugar-binding domain-containing protein [Mycobacterium sp. URHB0044]|jgi:MGT family glycosyltransferase|uniref:nucleotide disphospho-sugar-binding domain-containing protein n=1 Tax=Mycobacterium sp. URHB0044 TaxID=1380386 RepID=UPI000491F200|nr:nucleotide disphospho-sugar-binding domain-containing protein [Mycobacterium sp. URHB0044]